MNTWSFLRAVGGVDRQAGGGKDRIHRLDLDQDLAQRVDDRFLAGPGSSDRLDARHVEEQRGLARVLRILEHVDGVGAHVLLGSG